MAMRVLATTMTAALLGGCWLWSDEQSCESVEEYQAAEVAPEIDVPAGLDRPDPSTRLGVPAEPSPAEPLSRNAACLQRPPDYFGKPLKGPDN